MINKKNVVLAILLLISIIVLDIFKLMPFGRFMSYISFVISTIGHLIFLKNKKSFSKTIKTWYYIGIFLMLISITTCNIHYGQSLVSGFVANIKFYHIGSVMLFVFLFLKYRIAFPKLFAILIKAGWILLILIALMAITNFAFINESELTGKIIEVHAGKVSKDLINLIAIYWFSKFLFKSKYRYLVYCVLFFAGNHFHEIQRFITIVTLVVISIGILKNTNAISNLKFIIPAVFSIAFVSIFLLNSLEGASLIERFTEASKIFSEDTDVINDASTTVRIRETEFALSRFKLHPLFGNGIYRASEADKVIDEGIYFYHSDIGLFGILYIFGVLGIVIFIKQLKIIWQHLILKKKNQFHFTFVLILVFIILNSLLTGRSINNYDSFFFYVCLLQLSNLPMKRLIKYDEKV